ncbi:MAG: hypothetical protein PHD43_13170 [Methylococcales bacterium]|nr:hypothetical protein [Methylococcales bacterium]
MRIRTTDSPFGREGLIYSIRSADHFTDALRVFGLLALSGVFLYLYDVWRDGFWPHKEFLLHLAAIPLEILLGAVLVEGYLIHLGKIKRARQLMFIKSCLFRSDMRKVFLTNFAALERPAINMSSIRSAGLVEVNKLRESAQVLEYRSPEDMELVIMEYVNAYPVFHKFMEWAVENDFERIFEDMIFIMHFIQDVQLYKRLNPGHMFIAYAETNPVVMVKVNKVLGDGIVKFLDYAIELKEKQPKVFEELMSDYELSQLALNFEFRPPSELGPSL